MTKYITLVLLSSLAILSTNAHAQDQAGAEKTNPQPLAQIEEPKPLSANDLIKLESLGLYSKQSEGGYGKDLWAGSARSDITALLQAAPSASKIPLVNNMILSTLLTKAKASAIENDVLPAPGEDLLTLRIEKLLEAGAYTQAYELFIQREEQPYHERLARTGILAFLYNGEKSNACLEIKTYDFIQNDDFWKHIIAYCNISLSETPDDADLSILAESGYKVLSTLATDKDFLFPYSPDAFSALSTIEQALIAAEERLDVSGTTDLTPQDIPNAHIQLLLHQGSLPPELHFTLTANAVALGLIPAKTFEKLYAAIAKAQNDKNPDSKTPAPTEDFEKLPYYLEKIKKAEKKEQWALLQKIMPFTKKYGPAIFRPYAPLIANISAQEPSLFEITQIYTALIHNGAPIPDYWIDIAEKYDGDKKDSAEHIALRAAAHFAKSNSSVFKDFPLTSTDISPFVDTPLGQNLIIFMKSVDKAEDSAKTNSAYEKDFYLTTPSGYVMPTVVVWDRLTKLNNSKVIGETILLSTLSLHGQSMHQLYPGLLRDIVLSTQNVNLTTLSKNLAIVAILESTN